VLRNVEQEENQLCLTSCLCRFSEIFGINCSQEWLEGVLGIFGFYYTNNTREDGNVLHGMNADFMDIFQRYQTILQESLMCKTIEHNHDFIEQCREILKKHGPSLVWIDEKNMSYSPYYQKASSRSLVILYEMNEEKTVYFDRCKRECDTAFFLTSIDMDGEKRLYYVQEKELKLKYEEKQLCLIGVDRVVNHMNRQSLIENEYYGFVGMKRLLEDAKQCSSLDTFYNHYYQINRPGGLSYTRNNMGTFLEKMRSVFDQDQLSNLSNSYKELSQEWRLIGNMFFRLSQRMDSSVLERNIKRLLNVIQKEEEVIKGLRDTYQSIIEN